MRVKYTALAKQIATQRLTERYLQQCERWPILRDYVSLEGYIAVNLPYALANDKRKEKENETAR